MQHALVILNWLVISFLCSLVIWGKLASWYYNRKKDSYLAWYWLRSFGVRTTEENCVRFLKGVAWFALFLVTTLSVVVLAYAEL